MLDHNIDNLISAKQPIIWLMLTNLQTTIYITKG